MSRNSSLSVRKLQNSLQTKAKAEPSFRFYSLWDKVCRRDVLVEAHRRCRRNDGAPGVDGVTFDAIEKHGVESWLESLQEELKSGEYRTQPLLRVWIPKSNGGQRPLGIPTVRDRVAQMAVQLVLGPIFEEDLLPEQYAYRAGRDAKAAVRRAYFQVSQKRRNAVVDADLSDFFTTIPHGPLMRCLGRRVADGRLLSVIRQWLKAAVIERKKKGPVRTSDARRTGRGTPQGGVISPLLANIYFRRFLLAWKSFGIQERLDAHVVNYADDLVICCRPGNGPAAMLEMRGLMKRIGLTVNEEKTHLVNVPEESFDFLGYTIGRFYGKGGKSYLGTQPAKKSVARLRKAIHDETSCQWYASSPEIRVAMLNRRLRGWMNYFNQGPVTQVYRGINDYVARRFRRWLMRRSKKRGTGYRQYPDGHLYDVLGLFKLPVRRADLPNAKA